MIAFGVHVAGQTLADACERLTCLQAGGNYYLVNQVAIHVIQGNVVLTASSESERQVQGPCGGVAVGIKHHVSAGLDLGVDITTWNFIDLIRILVAEFLKKTVALLVALRLLLLEVVLNKVLLDVVRNIFSMALVP